MEPDAAHDPAADLVGDPGPDPDRAALLAAGNTALLAADWSRAAAAFTRAGELEPGPDALEGLGRARYWQGDHELAIDLLERAHRGHRETGDARAAANVAIHLAQLHALVHGDGSAMSAWVSHARDQVERFGEPCPEAGWVEVFRAATTADPDERRRRAATAVEIGRTFADPALEFDALAYLGKAHVEQGEIETGMELLDRAVAATAGGLVDDPWAEGEIWCTLFDVCELVGDVHRADQWLGVVDAYVAHTGERPIRAICRTHLGGVLVAAGRWDEAIRAFDDAREVFAEAYRPSLVGPVSGLAEICVRRGELERARRLLVGWEDHPAAALPRARLALAEGRPTVATDVLGRALRDPITLADAPLLETLVAAQVAVGDPKAAAARLAALEHLGTTTGHPAVRGRTALAAARLAVVTGADPGPHFDAALSSLSVAGLPWELAVARLEYAEALADTEPERAREHARLALDECERLGAADADRAARLLRTLGAPGRSQPRTPDALTNRQREVLALVAEGLTNAQVADRLCVSPRTVEDHVGNILRTLGVENRAAAVAWAHRHGATSDPANR